MQSNEITRQAEVNNLATAVFQSLVRTHPAFVKYVADRRALTFVGQFLPPDDGTAHCLNIVQELLVGTRSRKSLERPRKGVPQMTPKFSTRVSKKSLLAYMLTTCAAG